MSPSTERHRRRQARLALAAFDLFMRGWSMRTIDRLLKQPHGFTERAVRGYRHMPPTLVRP